MVVRQFTRKWIRNSGEEKGTAEGPGTEQTKARQRTGQAEERKEEIENKKQKSKKQKKTSDRGKKDTPTSFFPCQFCFSAKHKSRYRPGAVFCVVYFL